jgi:hypothetical protein
MYNVTDKYHRIYKKAACSFFRFKKERVILGNSISQKQLQIAYRLGKILNWVYLERRDLQRSWVLEEVQLYNYKQFLEGFSTAMIDLLKSECLESE